MSDDQISDTSHCRTPWNSGSLEMSLAVFARWWHTSARFMIFGNLSTMFLRAFLVFPVLSEHIAAKRSDPIEFMTCEFIDSRSPSVWILICHSHW